MAKAAAEYGSLPFKEQIEFFRAKLNLPTAHWTDIYTKEHDWAFVVAGATRDALLCDLRAAVEKAISQGTTLEEFRRDFDSIVDKHGWHGWTGEDRKGGKAWRTRTIYETNLATSYAAGRYQQLQHAPLWRYVHADWVTHPRPEHLAWDGLILPKDDPWWNTHFPPNGWGCKCSVQGVWLDELGDFGKKAPDAAPPDEPVTHEIGKRSPLGPRRVTVPAGIDPGFEYTPGKARTEALTLKEHPDRPPETPAEYAKRTGDTKPPVTGGASGHGFPNRRPTLPLLPPTVATDDDLLPPGWEPQKYAEAFLKEFGADKKEGFWKDAVGEVIAINEELFKDRKGKWKIKRGRGPWMLLLARALKEPDEIWARLQYNYATKTSTIRRRYVSSFELNGKDTPVLIVFERDSNGKWQGTTAFKNDDEGDAPAQDENDWRIGTLLYRREGKKKGQRAASRRPLPGVGSVP